MNGAPNAIVAVSERSLRELPAGCGRAGTLQSPATHRAIRPSSLPDSCHALARLLPSAATIRGGEILINGSEIGAWSKLRRAELVGAISESSASNLVGRRARALPPAFSRSSPEARQPPSRSAR